MHARQPHNNNSWKKWATHNHPCWYKLMILPPLKPSQATFSQGKPKQWKYDFTGWDVMKPRANYDSSGGPAQQTWPTTGPNITAPHIISSSAQKFSCHKAWSQLCKRPSNACQHICSTTNMQQQQHENYILHNIIAVMKGCATSSGCLLLGIGNSHIVDITAILDMPSGTHRWMAITCRHKISNVYTLHTYMGQQNYESKIHSLISVPTWQ